MEGVFGILFGIGIPGLIIFSWLYFSSREKQLFIKNNFTREQILDLHKHKKHPHLVLQIGLIIIFTGLGFSLSYYLDQYYYNDFLVPFSFFTLFGLGFIVAYFVARRLDKLDRDFR